MHFQIIGFLTFRFHDKSYALWANSSTKTQVTLRAWPTRSQCVATNLKIVIKDFSDVTIFATHFIKRVLFYFPGSLLKV